MKFLLIVIICFFIAGSVFGQDREILKKLEQMEWITEQYPPFNYIDEKDGQLKGYMVDILLEMWKIVGLQKTRADIKVHPWARGVAMLEENPAICLFSMDITEKRKKKFKFIGSAPAGIDGLIAKKSKAYHFDSIDEINEIFKHKNRIGAVREDVGGERFIVRGGNPELLYLVASGQSLVKMLEADRLDMIAYGEIVSINNMEKANINYKDYEMVFVLKQGTGNFAFNKAVDPQILQVMLSAFDKLNNEEIIITIRDNYLKNLGSSL